MKRLIITCDDAGLSRGINQSILKLNSEGLVTTASVMTNFDYLEDALQTLRESTIAYGVHLNLTDGYPLDAQNIDNRLINGDGRFNKSIYELMLLTAWPDARLLASVQAELILQIERLLALGIQPGHLTTHMHFHLVPSLRDIVFRLADQYDVNWVRVYHLARSIVPLNILQDHGLPPVYEPHRPGTLDFVMDISWWMRFPAQMLVQALLRLGGSVELVVHPSEPEDDTYPAYLPNKPAQRYAQVEYLREVMRILNSADHEFLLCDPSQA